MRIDRPTPDGEARHPARRLRRVLSEGTAAPVPGTGGEDVNQPAALGTDEATGQLILLTTRTGCAGVDTWRWGAGRWIQLHPSASPPPSFADGMAFDAAGGRGEPVARGLVGRL